MSGRDCVAPRTDHLQAGVAAKPPSVCSHQSMYGVAKAKGKRTYDVARNLTYTHDLSKVVGRLNAATKMRGQGIGK